MQCPFLYTPNVTLHDMSQVFALRTTLKRTIVFGNCTHYHRTVFSVAAHWAEAILSPAERHNTISADATQSRP